MTTDQIKLGETYDLSISGQDADGAAVDFPAGWSAACRVCEGRLNGDVVEDVTLTLAGGVFTGSIDTGSGDYSAGVYYYDVRFTDDAGNDFWSEPVRLMIGNRQTPPAS